MMNPKIMARMVRHQFQDLARVASEKKGCECGGCTCGADESKPLEITPAPTQSYEGNAYCVKCKENVDFTGTIKTSDSGRQMAMGRCPRCDTRVNRILGKAF